MTLLEWMGSVVVPEVGMTVWWWVEMTGWDCTGGGICGFSLSVFLSHPSSPHIGDIVGPLPPCPFYPICWGGNLSDFVP